MAGHGELVASRAKANDRGSRGAGIGHRDGLGRAGGVYRLRVKVERRHYGWRFCDRGGHGDRRWRPTRVVRVQAVFKRQRKHCRAIGGNAKGADITAVQPAGIRCERRAAVGREPHGRIAGRGRYAGIDIAVGQHAHRRSGLTRENVVPCAAAVHTLVHAGRRRERAVGNGVIVRHIEFERIAGAHANRVDG